MKPEISYLITLGDSLSDRGTFYHRHLMGIIPLNRLSGLHKKSPLGRFADGYVWGDFVSAMMANKSQIRALKETRHWDSTDIADAVLHNSPHVKPKYSLSNDRAVHYGNRMIMRNYNEAGLTAHNYHWTPSLSLKLSFRRNLVSTLNIMRQRLLDDDQAYAITDEQKKRTLIIEWTGANDLLVANTHPSREAVDKAIEARMQNMRQLIASGYRHFMIFNVPNFLLTPRYRHKSEQERALVNDCCTYFNEKLTEACSMLASENPTCSIHEFDVNDILTQGYKHPEDYHLNAETVGEAYIKSSDFVNKKSAKGYVFWDSLHFTSYIHSMVGEKVYSTIEKHFSFCESFKSTEETQQRVIEKPSTHMKSWVAGGLLATSAMAIGLHKGGVPSKAIAAGVGLAAFGLFAAKGIQRLMPSAPKENGDKIMAM